MLSAQLNRGIFDLFDPARVNPRSLLVDVRPLSDLGLFAGESGASGTTLQGGDSGSGFYDSVTQKLVGVAEGVHPAAPNVGRIVLVRHLCNWILDELFLSEAGVDTPHVSFEQHLDGDREKDIVKVSALAGDTHSVTIDSTELGAQTFNTTVSGSPDLEAGAIGNFTGTGRALVLAAEGTLVPAAFNGGPLPSISGGSGEPYRMVTAARMNANDRLDDLVAQREDGQIDVFMGSATGLVFDPTVQPFTAALDNDTLADFVWVDAAGGVHTVSSRFGRTFRNVNEPDPSGSISLEEGLSGRFRRVGDDQAGLEDIVVMGDGVVIWCKSTGGGGVGCEPALDAPFLAAGRIATGIAAEDLTRDGLDDLTITYSNSPPRIILGQDAGFSPSFGYRVRAVVAADVNADNIPDTLTFDDPDGEIEVELRVNPEGTGDFGPIATGIPFEEPFAVAVGNVNADAAEGPSALASGFLPIQDVVVLSGGVVFALVSNGDGTVAVDELDGAGGVVAIEVLDVTGDGIDDIEATNEDGSVSVYAGSAGGVDPIGVNFTGLPTADSNDGKMLLLSGLGVDTVGATEARLRLRVGPEDTAALANLTVDVFDGDNGGFHQFEEETNLLKTCYRLSADPCGDGNQGNCNGGPIPPTHLATVSSDALGDNVWDTIYDGPHAPEASLTGNGQPPFTYELRVYLSEDCDELPTPGATISIATADAFKVRSNGLLSQPLGEFSLVGSDSTGEFGLDQPYMPSTAFDGTFSLPIAVGASTIEIQLKEADADYLDDATPGVSLGENSDIQYSLLRPDGSPASLVGEEDASGTTLVTNPSGNNDGAGDLDLETRIHTLASSTPGTWQWRWENVVAGNAIHLFSPFGSPTAHEVLGARRAVAKRTTVEQPSFWRSDLLAAVEQLPAVLGRETAPGVLAGESIAVVTQAQAAAVLDNAAETLQGELERQLLVAKLNGQRALQAGENIRGAFVYGRTVTVDAVIRRADDVVAGFDLLATEAGIADLVGLLSAINLGDITYQHPGVPMSPLPMADDDQDGVPNLKDNCPSIANALQEDADDDRVGDACHVRPHACVLEREEGGLEAFFGYENPLSYRAFAHGSRNQLSIDGGASADPLPPTEFAGGFTALAFSAPAGDRDELSWTLDGETVSASASGARCSGRELTRLAQVPQTALFGSEGVILGDHTSVTAEDGLASVVSGGEVVLGVSSVVGHLVAGTSGRVEDYASVLGVVRTGAGLTKRSSAAVGWVKAGATPAHSLSWRVEFADNGPDVVLGAGSVAALPPGNYGAVVVPAQARLELEAGLYRFESLSVDEQGTWVAGDGETVVQVAGTLSLAGETRSSETSSLVLGYFGTEAVVVADSLHATLIAPHAAVTLGTVPNSVYTGAFFAKRVHVGPTTLVQFSER